MISVDGEYFHWRINKRRLSLAISPLHYRVGVLVVLHFPQEAYISGLCNPLYLTPHFIRRLIRDGMALGWPISRKTTQHPTWYALMEEAYVQAVREVGDLRVLNRKKNEALRKGRTSLLGLLDKRMDEVASRCAEASIDWEETMFDLLD